jgi:antitoxin (DNA-binding transcriptional repressor) of toxin-antitoxin stability system
MKPVDVRELKNRLSYYIRLVRRGRHVLVSDHGEIVAELSPPWEAPFARAGAPAELVSLALRGHVTLGTPQVVPVYQKFARALRNGTSGKLLDAERGPR